MRDAQESSSSEEQPNNILKSDDPATGELICPAETASDEEESRWYCPSHRELGLLPTSEDYMNHMRDVHETNPDDNKVHVLANSLQKLFLPYPSCDENEPQIGSCLKEPGTRYLKSLAIGSHPRDDDHIPGYVPRDEHSSNNLQPRSRSIIHDLDDESVLSPPYITNDDLDDVTEPDALAISGGKRLTDEFLRRDKTHSDPVWHSGHVMIDKADVISLELSDEQIGQKVNIQPEHTISSGFDMDSNDIEMEDF